MLRIIEKDRKPQYFQCDPNAEFQPGMVAQLTVIDNQVMATVSDGTAPIGVIDDIKSKTLTKTIMNEVVMIPAVGVPGPNNTIVIPTDIKVELQGTNILVPSFSSITYVTLDSVNGIITFLAGTPLNADVTGSGQINGIRTVVSYEYKVDNIPGADSTANTGKVTVWTDNMELKTDMYEANDIYTYKAPVYVSKRGLFTTTKPTQFSQLVGIVTRPPTSINSNLLEVFVCMI